MEIKSLQMFHSMYKLPYGFEQVCGSTIFWQTLWIKYKRSEDNLCVWDDEEGIGKDTIKNNSHELAFAPWCWTTIKEKTTLAHIPTIKLSHRAHFINIQLEKYIAIAKYF